MTRVANSFVDPKGIVAQYFWPINHNDMDPSGRQRTITATAPSAGFGLVRQQGVDQPMSLNLKGDILHEAQRIAFIQWWALCDQQSVYFYEFSGEQYEVMITNFAETKMPLARNLADPTIPFHMYNYSLDMDVLNILSGPWAVTANE